MEEPRAHTKHGALSLTEVAEALPGTGEVMRAVGHCFAMSWHAAQGGNWELANYYMRRTRAALRGLVVTRPKYAAQIAEYDRDHLERAYQAIVERDASGFAGAYADAVERANHYHVETGHAYIRWRTPADPPEGGLDLGPGSP